MFRCSRWLGLVTTLGLLAGTPVVAGTLYVQGVKAVLYSEPRLGADRVAEVNRGDRLAELETVPGWYKVSIGQKSGWISRLAVGANAKSGSGSLLATEGEELESGARRRASSFTTAAAARGLAEDRARVSQKYRVNYAGVAEMEQGTVTTEEALAFLQERGTP